MFTMKDLEPYFNNATFQINDLMFTLTKFEYLSGVHAVWTNDSYRIYATPYFDCIPVPVDVRDCNDHEIGLDVCLDEIEDFEQYKNVVEIIAAKIIRKSKM
jgi:hypothetical protein